MKKIISNKYLLYSIGIILIFIVWLLISLIINDPILVFPDPFKTIGYTFTLFKDSLFYKNLGTSMLRLLVGFAISFIIAFVLSLLGSRFKSIQYILKPTINVLKSIPTVALVFLFIVLVKPGFTPILIVILICFPILYEAISGGLNSIPKEIENSCLIDSANKLKTLFEIKLPLSLPYIFVGIASSLALSFKVEIMSEIIAGDTSYGLGVAIKNARQSIDGSNMVPVFAYCLVTIIIALLIDIMTQIIKKQIKNHQGI